MEENKKEELNDPIAGKQAIRWLLNEKSINERPEG